MDEPRWLSRRMVDTIHEDQLAEHGGLAGGRDENTLESVLMRPRQRWHYTGEDEATDLAALAAAYGYGLCSSHAYRDGNKRVAFQAMYVFLGLNGRQLEAPEPEVVKVMLDVGRGALGEDELAEWLRAHTAPR